MMMHTASARAPPPHPEHEGRVLQLRRAEAAAGEGRVRRHLPQVGGGIGAGAWAGRCAWSYRCCWGAHCKRGVRCLRRAPDERTPMKSRRSFMRSRMPAASMAGAPAPPKSVTPSDHLGAGRPGGGGVVKRWSGEAGGGRCARAPRSCWRPRGRVRCTRAPARAHEPRGAGGGEGLAGAAGVVQPMGGRRGVGVRVHGCSPAHVLYGSAALPRAHQAPRALQGGGAPGKR